MLQYADRLVYPHAGDEIKETKYGPTRYWSPASKFDLMNRLGSYEDLGYTPEELRELIKRVKS